MVKAAAERGWIDGPAVALEQLTAVKRAGADFVLTYFAGEVAEAPWWLSRSDNRRPPSSSGPPGDPGRGQLAGAFLPLGRRRTPTSWPGARAPTSGTPTATDCSTTCSPMGPSILGHAHPAVVEAVRRSGGGRHHLRRPDRGRGPAGRGHLRPRRGVRAGPPGVVGHRGGHERRPAGPGLHRPRPGGEVRRLLPRPLRRPAGRRRERGGHPRPARLGRRAAGGRGRDGGRPLQRGPRAGRATWPASSSSRWPPTWGWSRRRPGSSRGCGPPATPPARSWSSTR